MDATPLQGPTMRTIVPLLVILALTGCASSPPTYTDRGSDDLRQQVVEIATEMRGQPYVYGGESPAAGFDCSGLVHYAYSQAGVHVPRTTRKQYRAIRPRQVDDLAPGDVIFFRTKSARPSHVGIYIGDGEFVHALNADHPVRVDSINNDYWQRNIARAGRFRL